MKNEAGTHSTLLVSTGSLLPEGDPIISGCEVAGGKVREGPMTMGGGASPVGIMGSLLLPSYNECLRCNEAAAAAGGPIAAAIGGGGGGGGGGGMTWIDRLRRCGRCIGGDDISFGGLSAGSCA